MKNALIVIALSLVSLAAPQVFAADLVCKTGEPGTERFVKVVRTQSEYKFEMLEMSFNVPLSEARDIGRNKLLISNANVTQKITNPENWVVSAILSYRTTVYGHALTVTLHRTDYPFVLTQDTMLECW